MMAEPTKAELLAMVAELTNVVEQMHAEYANDVSPGRATAMAALRSHGVKIGHDCFARFDYDDLEDAVDRYPQAQVDTRPMRAA